MTSDTTNSTDELFARYVAGSLPLPARVLVEAHLEIRPENRALVAGLETMAGSELEEIEPAPIARRERNLDAIFSSTAPAPPPAPTRPAGLLPAALHAFVGFDLDHVRWRTRLPGFREYEIGEIEGCRAALFWIRPGRRIPDHTHEGTELSLVLDGAFTDIRGRFARGDISVADESLDHRPIAEKERPCIGFSVTDAPLRLTGPLQRRLRDLFGA